MRNSHLMCSWVLVGNPGTAGGVHPQTETWKMVTVLGGERMSQVKQAEYAMELKLAAVHRVRAGESVRAVAEELGIRRKRLYVWKDRYAELGEAGLARRRGGRPRKQTVAGQGLEARAGRGELL